ncbi:MAG TPA: type II toxin-antitoxin system RelE/ParE family toxin [Pyrinomonadaceae bacterium]
MKKADDLMIRNFKNKNLRRLFEDGQAKGIEQNLVLRLERRLDALNAATAATDLDIPGFDLHQLKGERRGTWSVKVSGNWRVTFTFKDGDAHEVDLEDYH